jgi:hypothetical protein
MLGEKLCYRAKLLLLPLSQQRRLVRLLLLAVDSREF